MANLSWLKNGFVEQKFYAPFTIEKDKDYYEDLYKRYDALLKAAKKAGADSGSIEIIKKYKDKILEAVRKYYSADIARSNNIIVNLLKEIGDDKLAVSKLKTSMAFPGEGELQLFRCRTGNPACAFSVKDMVHLPRSLRSKAGNYRFSIPGNPSLYLSNSSYGCWIETGFPSDNDFNVAPVLLDGTQVIFNLAVSIKDFFLWKDFEENKVHTWLKLLMLAIATSYRVNENGRVFKSEYVISQSIMMGCKILGYSGVAYYSKRVSDEVFARCAINLALFVNYKRNKEYSDILSHMKMDDSFNFSVFKNLSSSAKSTNYKLRSIETPSLTHVGSYDRQYPYRETEFYAFDKFLFSSWNEKLDNKGKNAIPWGIIL